ncbi:FHA domain-containing protein [Spirosoma sp. BT702]|uniref:FHA domain-containing protein n=1 Tax=Spirosoma profusum TaxID=2771354 RepID=A0A926XSQ2_9BACT|nr:FHA domain-containing protein [Spirosoma profusum]MBD2699293.1 FHA domain-containing protein [Spirosoma profusum]
MPALPVSISDSQFEKLIDDFSQLSSYSIGRGTVNDIIIANPKISTQHARLIQCTPTTFLLEDLASKHGSFVNGYRITRKLINTSDVLRLADAEYTAEQLLLLSKQEPVMSATFEQPATLQLTNSLDFTRQFAELRQVYEQYPQLRRDCRNRDKMIRTGSVILSSVVGVSAVLASGGTAAPLLHILSGAGLSMLVPTLCSTLLSTEEKLEVLDKEYREQYRCPNPACRDPFGMREWELLAQQKTCRRCQAIWVK